MQIAVRSFLSAFLPAVIASVFFSILPAQFSAQAAGLEFQGKVMQVKDGDTIVVSPQEGGEFMTCRLLGIDTPETAKRGKEGQPYGEEAAMELKKLILGQQVMVNTTGAKTWGREVCRIEKGRMDVNLEMVKRGYAWAYRQYLRRPYASEYIDA